MALSTQGTSIPSPFIYHFDSQAVRTYLDEQGEPWFCAKDVCAVLGYVNDSDAIKKHCRTKGVAKRYLLTKGGYQALTFINEGNLYRLIIKSRLPAAERFEAWVCEEVLPAIRKTGQYTLVQSPRITREQYRQLADLVYRWGCCFAYSNSARHAAWQLARSICGTRATDMPAQAFPAVLAAFKATHKHVDDFLTQRHTFEKNAIRQVFGHNTLILPQPNFPQLPPDPFLAR